MCSEPAMAGAAGPPARCLLCNVGCPVRIIKSGLDRYLPDYVPHAGYAGLCGRGSVLVELLDHPDRFFQAERHVAGGRLPLGLKPALDETAAALREGSAAVIVDGNLDLDTISAAGRLAAACGAAWSVFVPPSDAGLVSGLDAGGCQFTGPEGLAEADSLLLIGNLFATHPVAAHWIFEAKRKRPRMPILVMADASGVTADFAASVFQPRLAVGETARAVAAVRTGKAEALGPDARVLSTWKDRLRAGKSPMVAVAAELGSADAAALAAEVTLLAKELGARVCPLTAYGNAWGAVRLAVAGGALSVDQVLAAAPRTLVVIGADIESTFGARAVGPALEKVERLIFIGPMPTRTGRRASLVLPAAFTFEADGRALLGPGREVSFAPLLRPPAGVLSTREILKGLGGQTDPAADVSGAVAAAAATDCGEPYIGPEEGILVAPAGDPFHFADGSLTRAAAWPQVVRPRPILMMAEIDARAASIADSGRAVIEAPGGSVEVDVATSALQRPGQARVSAAFAEVRDAMGWTWRGPRPGEPVRVIVRKV